jgi:hypothetical protein
MRPKVGLLTKIYYSDKAVPTESDLTQVLYTEEIPQLEEAPEAIAYQTVDMPEEYSEQGSKKASQPVIPVLYISSQHTSLKKLADSKKIVHWFVLYPETTCGEGEKPLCKSFEASCALTDNGYTKEDMIKDNLTLYRTSSIKETLGLPTA